MAPYLHIVTKFTQNYHYDLCSGDGGRNIRVRGGPFSKEAMTEQQRRNLWSILACAAIVALIGLVLIQQSWVK